MIFKKNSELGFMFDVELVQDTAKRLHMKRLAIDTCASFLARTISQSEFRIRQGNDFENDELYYRLNVRPNKNMTASTFWQTVITKLIYDNECLIIQADDDDLLIADDFERNAYAVLEDTFSKVKIKEYEFKRTFKQSDVLHLRYSNEKLAPLIDGLFADYGELFGRILSSQKRKNQIRGTVDMDMIGAKSKEQIEKLQEFIDNMYKAVGEKDIAIVPQQRGIKYEETYNGASNGPSVDEVNKVTNGFLDQVAMAIGIPVSLLHGDMADVEKQTKNYMMYTVGPLLKKISDEGNSKFFTKEEYLQGMKLEIKSVSFQSIFDLANAIDKLRGSGVFNGNELRSELGKERVDDPMMDKYFITKNYVESSEALKGGENENDGDN
ncbi:phage portal protein [Cytobacillus oceanisediminis]|nr:phage portal protein [Cytobacillus oceanisediminis]USK46341.1 phage portal protein [Cytobacillus oceanisediminis]